MLPIYNWVKYLQSINKIPQKALKEILKPHPYYIEFPERRLGTNHYYKEESHTQVNYKKTETINRGFKKYNVLKVIKEASNLTYYINDIEVHKSGGNRYHGYKVAFFAGDKLEMEIDYIKVTKSPEKINIVDFKIIKGQIESPYDFAHKNGTNIKIIKQALHEKY